MCLSPPSHVFQPFSLLPRLLTPVHLSPVVFLLLCVLVPCVCLCPYPPLSSVPYPLLSCVSLSLISLSCVCLCPYPPLSSVSYPPLSCVSLSLISLSCVCLCPLSPSLVCPLSPLLCVSLPLIPLSRVSLSLIPSLVCFSSSLMYVSLSPHSCVPHPTPSCVFMNPSCVSPVGPRRYDREYLLQFRSKGECQIPPPDLLNKDCYKKK